MKRLKVLGIALLLCLGIAIPALAHDVTGARAWANQPSYVGGEFYFLAYAQIDGCVETPESTPHKNGNCGRGPVPYTTGFVAKVKSRGQINISNIWVSVTPVATRAVTMGTGFGHQIYGSSFAVTSTRVGCPSVNGSYQFRTLSQLGFNWHGSWGWTSWVPSTPVTVVC